MGAPASARVGIGVTVLAPGAPPARWRAMVSSRRDGSVMDTGLCRARVCVCVEDKTTLCCGQKKKKTHTPDVSSFSLYVP